MNKKKKSCFLNTSAEANLLFSDLSHPANGPGGLHALSNISRKKKKKKREKFPYRFPSNGHVKVLSQNSILCSANKTGTAGELPSPGAQTHTVNGEGGLRRGQSTRPCMLNHMRRLELCSKPLFALPFPTRGVGFHVLRPSNTEAQGATVRPLPAGLPSTAPPTASHWWGHYVTLGRSYKAFCEVFLQEEHGKKKISLFWSQEA